MLRSAVPLVLVAMFAAGGCSEEKIGLPAGFPADVPLPEGAVLRTVRDLGMKGLNVVFETQQGALPLADRLGERLSAAGWSVLSEARVDEAFFSSWRKGERSVALGVSSSGAVTVVGFSVVERPYNEWEEGG